MLSSILELAGLPIHWASTGLLILLKHDASVLFLCLFGAGWCWLFIDRNRRQHLIPALNALNSRQAALEQIASAPDPETAQLSFAETFTQIDEVMANRDRLELALAWEQFRETFISEDEPVIRTTARAEAYFLHLADDTRVLAWGANMAVGLGLTATFLGLIAALTSATDVLSGATSGTDTTVALQGLLKITAAKFWTSVTGIICSVFLRRTDRSWHEQLQSRLEALCQVLDRGTLFTPAQRLANEQLREMKRQTEAFQVLGTELAAAIDNALDNRMSPVVSVLGNINKSIEQFGQGGFDQISRDLGEALSNHAGKEMQQLGATLGLMAGKFEELSTGLADVPATLEKTMADLREKFATEQEAARKQQTEAAEQMSAQLRELAEKLQGVTTGFSEELSTKIQSMITNATDTGGEVLGKAFAKFGEEMSRSADELIGRLSLLAQNAEPLSAAMARAAEAAGTQADRLHEAGQSTEAATAKMTDAVRVLETTLEPVSNAADRVREAADSIRVALAAHERATEEFTGQLIATASAAEGAWSNYQSRFDQVDEALGNTLEGLVSGATEHATALNQQVSELDLHLAKAVGNLRDVLGPLEDLAEEISALLEKLNA